MQWDLSRLGSVISLNSGDVLTGDELQCESTKRAAMLANDFGTEPKNYVIAHGNSPSFFADLFAVWHVGGCAVCVNAGLTASELENVIDFVEPAAILVNTQHIFDTKKPVINLNESSKNIAPFDGLSGSLDANALILFTSGTTGKPKGVVHSHRSLLSRIALNQTFLGADVLRKTLCVLPTHFGHGLIGNCLTALLCGGDVFLYHGGGVLGTAKLGTIIDEQQISFMSSVPSFWKIALKVSAKPTGKSLQRINIGSAPLSAELWQQVIDWSGINAVANMYGITETANWIGGALASEYSPHDGLLGKPWAGSYAVRDDKGDIHPVGEGEVLIQVSSLMTEYYQRPDLTDEVLQGGWYYTGDTGRIDEQGNLLMTGRNKYMINRGGMKIYPEEIDLLLERHPNIIEACAFALPDGMSGELVAAAIKFDDGKALSAAAINEWLSSRIRQEAMPSKLFFLAEIPKTDRGKLNRDNVAAFCLDEDQL